MLTDLVLPPIPTNNLTGEDVEELTSFTRETMLRALTKLTETPPGQRAFRPNGLAVPVSRAKGSATIEVDGPGKSSAVAADGAGDELRRNVVQKEMGKRAVVDGLAE